MDIIYLIVFALSVAFTWEYGDVVDEYQEHIDKKIKEMLDNKD